MSPEETIKTLKADLWVFSCDMQWCSKTLQVSIIGTNRLHTKIPMRVMWKGRSPAASSFSYDISQKLLTLQLRSKWKYIERKWRGKMHQAQLKSAGIYLEALEKYVRTPTHRDLVQRFSAQ